MVETFFLGFATGAAFILLLFFIIAFCWTSIPKIGIL